MLFCGGEKYARVRKGSITIPAGIEVWEHELRTAQALADHGYAVWFIAKYNPQGIKSADILVKNALYEIKSPKADKLSAVERNLKRASK